VLVTDRKTHSAIQRAFDSRRTASADVCIDYQLLKYGLGRDCQILKQPFTSATLGPGVSTATQTIWLCGQLDFFDGTSNGEGLVPDPNDFRAISVSTSSSRPLAAGNAEENFPKGFLALPFLYSFEFD
jgi:hypothetical protein